MKIEFIKSGPYCLDSAKGPIVDIEEGTVTTLDDKIAIRMISDKWAKPSDDEDQEEEEEVLPKLEATLRALIKDREEEDQKQKLKDWYGINHDRNISMDLSVEEMISEILQELEDE